MGGEVWYQSSSSESWPRHWRGGCKGSAKSEGTLKHSVSLTRKDELRNWDPMNFLISENGGSMATTR